MKKKIRFAAIGLLFVAAIVLAIAFLRTRNLEILNAQGTIAAKERTLIIFAAVLSLAVVVPVFALTASIVWRYRADKGKGRYSPELAGNNWAELAWWAIPSMLILLLSVVTWRSSHELDPFKAIRASAKPMTIQVVALDWKWLFIYPGQHIASVNFLELPVNTPVVFDVTADAPMNSLWIPQLGGQIYAMPGMSTQLHLMASKAGDYAGSSANISGEGFAGMRFTAHAVSQANFQAWVKATQQSPQALTQAAYEALTKPSQNNPPSFYTSPAPNLYATIIMNYMMPMPPNTTQEVPLQGGESNTQMMPGMSM